MDYKFVDFVDTQNMDENGNIDETQMNDCEYFDLSSLIDMAQLWTSLIRGGVGFTELVGVFTLFNIDKIDS